MEFLFDDEWVDRKAGVRRVLGSLRRETEPVFKAEMPWEAWVGYFAVIYDEQESKFKLWYRAFIPADAGREIRRDLPPSERGSGKQRSFVCYAESADGIKWVRPSLGVFDFRGSRDNNILLEVFEGIDTVFYNVIKDPDDPDPSRRYKAIGFEESVASALRDYKAGNRGVCVGYSSDGIHWPYEPKLVMDASDLTDADYILPHREPTTGKWVAFFKPRTHPKRRFVGYSESDDFEHWTYPRMLLSPDLGDDEWIETHGLPVVCIGRWRIGLLHIMHNNPESSPMTGELAYSRDGLNYRRAMPGVPFPPLGPKGSFDSRLIEPERILQHGSEVYMYYSGANSHFGSDRGLKTMLLGRTADGEPPQGGLGLARVPVGHFCGLLAEFDGMVETKWVCNYGDAGVSAWAETERDGWVRAEILDQYGDIIPGWNQQACRVRQGDDGKVYFWWERDHLVGKSGQSSAAGGKVGHVVKVRFYLHQAALYGFQVGEDNAMPDYV